MGQQDGGDPFIYEHAAMLRIVSKFDDVMVPIGGFHEKGLGAAAHAAQRSTGENGGCVRQRNAVDSYFALRRAPGLVYGTLANFVALISVTSD